MRSAMSEHTAVRSSDRDDDLIVRSHSEPGLDQFDAERPSCASSGPIPPNILDVVILSTLQAG